MPIPALEKMAERAKGKSLQDAERYWDEAKDSAADQGFKEGDDNFYRYTMGIVKRRLGLASYVRRTPLITESYTRRTVTSNLDKGKYGYVAVYPFKDQAQTICRWLKECGLKDYTEDCDMHCTCLLYTSPSPRDS